MFASPSRRYRMHERWRAIVLDNDARPRIMCLRSLRSSSSSSERFLDSCATSSSATTNLAMISCERTLPMDFALQVRRALAVLRSLKSSVLQASVFGRPVDHAAVMTSLKPSMWSRTTQSGIAVLPMVQCRDGATMAHDQSNRWTRPRGSGWRRCRAKRKWLVPNPAVRE